MRFIILFVISVLMHILFVLLVNCDACRMAGWQNCRPSVSQQYRFRPDRCAATLPPQTIRALIVTRLDCCNSLLAGCNKQLINKLQCVLNCAARVIFGGNCRDHITPLLRNNLHWLRVRERVTFKLWFWSTRR